MKARVLVLEDDQEISDLIALYLEKEGMEVKVCSTAEAALEYSSHTKPQLVTVDLNLPGMDGFEFIQKFRESSAVPLLVISAREADEDMLLAFGGGADDFVCKPFSPKILAARIRAHIRRSKWEQTRTDEDQDQRFTFGPWELDLRACELRKSGSRVALSPREFDVLVYLARRSGTVISTQELYREVWGNEYGDLITVSVHIQRLRKKLEDEPSKPFWIETVHGFGYRLRKEDP